MSDLGAKLTGSNWPKAAGQLNGPIRNFRLSRALSRASSREARSTEPSPKSRRRPATWTRSIQDLAPAWSFSRFQIPPGFHQKIETVPVSMPTGTRVPDLKCSEPRH